MTRTRSTILAFAVFAAVLGACGDGDDAATPGDTDASVATAPDAPDVGSAAGASVSIKNSAFSPASVSVKSGDKVTWSFDEAVPHQVKADDGSFDSGEKSSGTFVHTFSAPGTVAYHCEIHKFMKGTVAVS